MSEQTSPSVLSNLNDLFGMEVERRVAVAAEEAQLVAQRARAAERAQREREQALAAARRAERLRIERERAALDEVSKRRIERLRSELASVRAERARAHERLLALATDVPQPPPRRGWVPGLMASASLVAAFTALFVAWPGPVVPVSSSTPAEERVIVGDAVDPVRELAVSGPVRSADAVEDEAALSEPAPVTDVEPAPVRPLRRDLRPQRRVVRRPPPVERTDQLDNDLRGIGGTEVLTDDFLRSISH